MWVSISMVLILARLSLVSKPKFAITYGLMGIALISNRA